jgi:hypothetical protein
MAQSRTTRVEEVGLLLVAAGTWLYASSPSIVLALGAIPSAKRAGQISTEVLPYSVLISLLLYGVACVPLTLLPSRTEVACVCVSALIYSWTLDASALVAIVNGVALFLVICILAIAGRLTRCAAERGARRVDDTLWGAQAKPADAALAPSLLQSEPSVRIATSPQKCHHPTPRLQPIGPGSPFSPQQGAMLLPALPSQLSLFGVSVVTTKDASLVGMRVSRTSSLGSPLGS